GAGAAANPAGQAVAPSALEGDRRAGEGAAAERGDGFPLKASRAGLGDELDLRAPGVAASFPVLDEKFPVAHDDGSRRRLGGGVIIELRAATADHGSDEHQRGGTLLAPALTGGVKRACAEPESRQARPRRAVRMVPRRTPG